MVVNAFLVYQFIKRLVTPFNKMPAYEAGLIDADGNFLKNRNSFNAEEKKKLQRFDVMIINLKKLIAKVPFGKTRIATIAAALYLIRSKPGKNVNEELVLDDTSLEEGFNNIMKEVEKIYEDGTPAVNSTAGIAGLTPDTLGVPVAAAKRYKKKNTKAADILMGVIKRKRSNLP
jgi:hypothetical protein